jgi:hypothetical protein
VGIDPLNLPNDSPFFGYALAQAQRLVIRGRGGLDYTLACYNAAGHILFQIAPDQAGRSYFRDKRAEFGLYKPVAAGVVSASSDEGTSVTLATPSSLRDLTLSDLNFMRTPWGQEYLAYNTDFGGLFGVS